MASAKSFDRDGQGISSYEHYALGYVKLWFRFAKFSCPRCGKRHTIHRGEAYCTCGKPRWTTFEYDGFTLYAHWQDDLDVGPANGKGRLKYVKRS